MIIQVVIGIYFVGLRLERSTKPIAITTPSTTTAMIGTTVATMTSECDEPFSCTVTG